MVGESREAIGPKAGAPEETLATIGLICVAAACLALLLVASWPALGLAGEPAAPAWQRALQSVVYLASMPPLALAGGLFCLVAIWRGRHRGQAGWRRAALGLGLGVVALGYWITLLIWLMASGGA